MFYYDYAVMKISSGIPNKLLEKHYVLNCLVLPAILAVETKTVGLETVTLRMLKVDRATIFGDLRGLNYMAIYYFYIIYNFRGLSPAVRSVIGMFCLDVLTGTYHDYDHFGCLGVYEPDT